MEKNNKILTTLEEYLDKEFGQPGTPERKDFDRETEAFCLAATLREERRKAGLTQEALAERIGTKKTYISRIENGKTNIQLETLFKIFKGLGKQVSLTII